MTSRERLLTVLKGEIPDCVPCAPDTSNMIPCRLTGKPFWDIYLYQDPPLWKAYLEAVKFFGFDSLMDGYFPLVFEEEKDPKNECRKLYIIKKTDEEIVTQARFEDGISDEWAQQITLFRKDNPPVSAKPEKIGLPDIPKTFEPVEGVKQWPEGEELHELVRKEMGDRGLVGVWCGTSLLLHNQDDIMDYFDNPGKYKERSENMIENYKKRFARLINMETKPDFICTGGSGTLIWQTPDIFRELALPIIQTVTKLCKDAGLPSHIHSCGPEKEIVKIAAEETDLTVIDPLEIPPMGNCILSELKKEYGDRLVLKGNLHTTDVMLRGSVDDVIKTSKQAIDDAAEGGRFILSSGDQCGRDTPDENIFAMIETARSYGKY